MFPFTSCVSILRRHESATDWKQVNGTMTIFIGSNNDHKRRGAISFERTDKNAVYIRMLGDVKMRGSPDKPDAGPTSVISDADKKMLDKLNLPDQRQKFRSRFMSMTKARRKRRSRNKLSDEGRLLVDEFYHTPAKLLLSHLGDWDFNIFSLDILSGGRSVFHVAYHLFQTYDLIRVFQLESVRLMQFFSLVEENYHDSNPYHNAVHAADVTQSMHCYLQEREVYESTSDLEKMAALVAALTHDLDHPGVNNTFLIVTSNHLAALYHNISVLENHHWRSAVGLLQETGIVSHLSSEQRESFVQQLKALILATDITRQQEFLLKFSRYIESGEFQYRRNEEHRHFMLQIALKCADISNPCRPWKISQRWSKRICQEFFLQGDMERSINVAVTPLCDRFGNTVPNIQHGFMQFVVNPLFKAWDKFMNTELSAQMMSHLAHNQAQWKSIMDRGEVVEEGSSDSEDGKFEEEIKGIETVGIKLENLNVIAATRSSENISGGDEVSVPVANPVVRLALPDEEEEGRSEEDDVVVENDVNLVYHYQAEPEESGRCLSPVSEDSEHSSPCASSIRRFSVPHVVRKDLNFYLGLRKDNNSQFFRRQSLPTTAMFFHGSYTGASNASAMAASPRSLSMDTLLARPKISNLSPSMEASFAGGALDPVSFTPLQNQTLMLQGGSWTRFTSNPTPRRASYEPSLLEHSRAGTNINLTSDLEIPPFKEGPKDTQKLVVGLASSWPSVARRRTTNGSTHPHQVTSPPSSNLSINSKTSLSFSRDDNSHQSQQSISSSLSNRENSEDNNNLTPADSVEFNSPELQHNYNNNNASVRIPHCLSIADSSSAQDDHNLPRPQ